jgi:hypothetical protein
LPSYNDIEKLRQGTQLDFGMGLMNSLGLQLSDDKLAISAIMIAGLSFSLHSEIEDVGKSDQQTVKL